MSRNKKTFKKPQLLIFGLVGFLIVKTLFFPNKLFNLGFLHMRQEYFWVLILTGFSIMMGAVWDQWKYKSHTQIGHGLNTSFNSDDIHHVGKWIMTRRGGIDVRDFSQPGREGIAIFPDMAYEYLQNNLLAKVVFFDWELNKAPYIVKQYVENEGLPTKDIKLGLAAPEIEHNNQAYIEWKKDWENQNQGKNSIRTLLDKGLELNQKVKDMGESPTKNKIEGKLTRVEEKINEED